MQITKMKFRGLFQKITFFAWTLFPVLLHSQTVNSWLTTGDQNFLFEQQGAINFVSGTRTSAPEISIDTTSYQSIDGFGFCLTEGSAEALTSLDPSTQDALFNELFNKATGLGISVLRISIGASDLSSYSYSYDDIATGTDLALSKFSLAGPDLNFLIPVLKKILAINPAIKILGSPWSAPKWMKTVNSWVGGSLKTSCYAPYANYFVKYLDAMKAQGINIWGITVQNEPENPKNEPSMTMTAVEQINFINNNLGPAFKAAGYSTKIIGFDHNCDNISFPTDVCNKSSFVDGAAFHLYAGPISALTTVHNATSKNVYFTEQYTPSGADFSGELGWQMTNVMIGSTQNWAKIALEWNLATNANFGPRTPGGCTTCMGAITINGPADISRNVSYYVVSHMSKVVKPGAKRIKSITSDANLSNVAFQNPDGSTALVVMNNSPSTSSFSVNYAGQNFTYTLTGNSASSMIWGQAKTGILESRIDPMNVQISPNPSYNDFTLKVGGNLNNNYEVKLFSSIGTLLSEYTLEKGQFELTVDAKAFASGIYFLQLNSGDTVMYKKIVKN